MRERSGFLGGFPKKAKSGSGGLNSLLLTAFPTAARDGQLQHLESSSFHNGNKCVPKSRIWATNTFGRLFRRDISFISL